MPTLPLVCHPCAPSDYKVTAGMDFSADDGWIFRYAIQGDIGRLSVPGQSEDQSADEGERAFTEGLWRHTCCEAFIKPRHSRAYHEFNFAPSGNWALYRFDDYRQGMTAIKDCPPPRIEVRQGPDRLDVHVNLDIPANIRPAWARDLASAEPQLALSAVLEDRDGKLSYWALAHPPGKPDFHHAAGFVATLPSRFGETR